MRAIRLALATVMVLVMVPASPAAAEPFDADPLGLVPFADTVMRVYSQGTDAWEVWVCTTPDHPATLSASAVVTSLNAEITPYFQWLSVGRYTPTFTLGGEVASTESLAFGATESAFAPDCQKKVRAASDGGERGALIVVDAPFDAGYGTAGGVCPEPPFSGCTTEYPGNFREVVVAAATVTTVSPFDAPQWITVAHMMGHALNMPHSYSGLTTDPNTGTISRYDNPMDVMSGDYHSGDPIGTHAFNRYSAGWIDPTGVAVHQAGTADYTLAAIGSSGLGMVVVPSVDPGRFFVLDARRRTSFDSTLPTSGVEIHEIDTRREAACFIPPEWPSTWPCFATLVRIKQFPAKAGISSTSHVLGIDDSEVVENFTVTVTAATTGTFTIRVAVLDRGRFIDDDGLTAEPDIETIAALGITLGCNPPDNDRFCPADGVSRAQMATFIVRALGEEANIEPYQGLFSDVAETAWYAGYVERLADLGITTGTGPEVFAPDRIVSRSEMAAFLIRGFGTGEWTPAGVFADIAIDAWYIEEVEELFSMGVTTGCSSDPLFYCPNNQVTRAQMASFLARILS
ncbi:MAG: S-layer homology domain-containing protein [Acidimicrobiia bacterium]